MLKVAARHADVWNPTRPARGGGLERAREVLRRECDRIGRDWNEIRLAANYGFDASSRESLIEAFGEHLRLGFTEHILNLPAGSDAPRAAELAGETLAELRQLVA